jgi:hypothetical protein
VGTLVHRLRRIRGPPHDWELTPNNDITQETMALVVINSRCQESRGTAQKDDAQNQESSSRTRSKSPLAAEEAGQSRCHHHKDLKQPPVNRCSETAQVGRVHPVQCKCAHPQDCHENGQERIRTLQLKKRRSPLSRAWSRHIEIAAGGALEFTWDRTPINSG